LTIDRIARKKAKKDCLKLGNELPDAVALLATIFAKQLGLLRTTLYCNLGL
jgi:hypothetical protein